VWVLTKGGLVSVHHCRLYRTSVIHVHHEGHMGNVFRRGGQDTLLSEARRNAAAFFRAGGANLQLGGAPIDTSKDTKTIKPSPPGGRLHPVHAPRVARAA
jgi:hypothetical protein